MGSRLEESLVPVFEILIGVHEGPYPRGRGQHSLQRQLEDSLVIKQENSVLFMLDKSRLSTQKPLDQEVVQENGLS